MPIKIDDALPARQSLENENIFVMTEQRAMTQDIRPLKILLVNLMPTKIETETQILRLLSNSPLQVDIELLQMVSHKTKTASAEHMLKFYRVFNDIKDDSFDGMIVTGAPVELMKFEDVDYWGELCEILDWAQTHVYSVMHICWGAQAGLYHRYGVPKYTLSEKMFGVFPQKPLDLFHPLLRGFDGVFYAPHSRHTEVRFADIAKVRELQILAYSELSGIHIISDMECRNFYVFGHCEYDADTLAKEYFRDKGKGLEIKTPYNYFPDDDTSREPVMKWRCEGTLLFTNWLNYFVYQQTPYDLSTLATAAEK